MVLLLTLFFACQAGPDAVATPPTVDATALAVRQGIQAAHRAWSGGQFDVARAAVMDTYRQSFEPLEPALRANNARETLELEYAFAQLSNHLGRKGSAVEVAAEVRDLVERIDKAVGALPKAANAPPAAQTPPPAASTTSTTVVPAGGVPPGRPDPG